MTVRIYRSDDASAPVLNGTAGSLITVLDACLVNGYGSKTAAGWTKPYSGTNLAVYRMSTIGSSGCYMRVDDSATLATGRDARVVGYKTMSDVNTGTSKFPTDSQSNNGAWLKKSSSADSITRPWTIIADERLFYFFTYANQTIWGTSSNADGNFCFGDIISNRGTDGNECILVGQTGASTGNADQSQLGQLSTSYTNGAQIFLAKDFTGLATSQKASFVTRAPYLLSLSTAVGYAQTVNAYPDLVTGGISLFEIEILENNYFGYRGIMPGYYYPNGGTLVGNVGDTFPGTDNLSGKNFILMGVASSQFTGRGAFQYDGDWRV